MADYALKISIGLDGVPQVTGGLKSVESGMDSTAAKTTAASGRMAGSMDTVGTAIKAAVAAFGLYKLVDYAKDAALLAARYDTLGVVMTTVGNNAGYTKAQMDGFEQSLQKQGIAMVESRQVLTQMASAHMDLAKSSELARIAQDAAVIGQMNSSQAFEQMITGIQRGETEIMKTLGLNVDFMGAQQMLAAKLNKTTQELTTAEKVQANMNATMLKGKDIAGTYEAAMGTAGKQISSMQRYMDNLKVTLGGVFNDVLIMGVQAFTGVLKEGNTEAEKLAQEGQLKAWGRDLVMIVATIADGLTIVWNVLKTGAIIAVAHFASLYDGAVAIGQALKGNFAASKEAFDSMINNASVAKQMISDQWEGATKYQDAAKKMYADRDNEANKLAQAEKAAALEKKQMTAGAANQAATANQEQELFVKKHQADWGKIVVAQLESVGAYEQAAQKAAELNKETDAYKTLLNSSKEAQAALAAQQLLDTNKLLEAKRKELEFENSHIQAMQGLQSAKLAAMGVSSEEITLMMQKKTLALEEKVLQDQINTETNPRRKAQLEEQLQAQMSINSAIREESESRLKIIQNQQALSAMQQSMKMSTALGQDTQELQKAQTLMAYETRRLELQQQLTAARAAENSPLANITQQMQSQLDLLYSQSSASDDKMNKLRGILGLEQGITKEKQKQVDTKYRNTDGEEVVSSQKIVKGDEYLNQLKQNLQSVLQYAPAIEYATSLQKQIGVEQGRLQDIENNKYQKQIDDQRLADQQAAADRERGLQEQRDAAEKAAIAAAEERAKEQARINAALVQKAQDAVSAAVSSINTLASSLKSMADGLRAAAINLREAYNSNLTTTGGAVSPEQAYLNAKAVLEQTASQAQATGDVALYNQIPQLVQQMLSASQAYNASGTGYQTDFARAQSLLLASAGRADTQATAAEQAVVILSRQEELLTAIKTALSSGGDTAGPLAAFNANNGALQAAMGTLNGTMGGTTTAVNTGLGATSTIATRIGTKGTTDSLAALMEANRAASALVNTTVGTVNTSVGTVKTATDSVGTYTSGANTKLGNSYLASQTAGRLNKATTVYPSQSQSNNSTTYTYFASGGIADDPSGRSIFGEAGPEAAVPLPDGRSIPVTLSGWASADNKNVVAVLERMEKRLEAVESNTATGNRIARAVGEEAIAIGTRQARSSEDAARTSRQAANQ